MSLQCKSYPLTRVNTCEGAPSTGVERPLSSSQLKMGRRVRCEAAVIATLTLSHKFGAEYFGNPGAHESRVFLREACHWHTARRTARQLNVRLARESTQLPAEASAILEQNQVSLINAPEHQSGWLLPSSATRTLIKNHLLHPLSPNQGLPLGQIKSAAICGVFKAPRHVALQADVHQPYGNSH